MIQLIPPALEPGQSVQCRVHGPLIATGRVSKGPLRWPLGARPGTSEPAYLIVTGDLIPAIRQESAAWLSRQLGVGQTTILRYRRILGGDGWTVGSRARVAEGAAKGRDKRRPPATPATPGAKLDAAGRAKARRLDAEGVPRVEIARRLKVSRNTIWNLLEGRTWKQDIDRR